MCIRCQLDEKAVFCSSNDGGGGVVALVAGWSRRDWLMGKKWLWEGGEGDGGMGVQDPESQQTKLGDE